MNSTSRSNCPPPKAVVPVFYCTIDGAHPGPSGYNNLLRFMTGTSHVAVRLPRHGLVERLVCGVLKRGAVSGWVRGASLWLELKMLWQLVTRPNPAGRAVAHAIWADRDLGYGDLFARWLGVPFVATFHACPRDLADTARFASRCQKLSGLVLMASNQRAHFEKLGVDPARIRVIHHGVDDDFFEPPSTPPAGTFTVAFAGSYNRDFSQLRALIESMVGDPVRFRLLLPAHVADQFAGFPHVDLFRNLSPGELRRFYQDSHLLVMCVVDSTANNAILEAMACGLPVVADEAGSSGEYTGPDAGVIVPRGDVHGLRREIIALRESPERRLSLARAARRRAVELSWRKVATRLEAFHAEILERERQAASIR